MIRKSLKLTFVKAKTVRWADGMVEKERVYRYQGKLWKSGDVLFGVKTVAQDAAKTMRRSGMSAVVVPASTGRGYIVLHRKTRKI